LRRLAEWRLGEPQPFDTGAYLTGQTRVLALILVFPEPIAAHPGTLAFGVAAAVALDEFYGFFAGNVACKIIKQLLIAYGLQRIQMALWVQTARLCFQASAKHLINPLIDALVQFLARQFQP